jgi:hypothetical protein
LSRLPNMAIAFGGSLYNMSEREAIGIDDMAGRARRRRCVHYVPQIPITRCDPCCSYRLSTNQGPEDLLRGLYHFQRIRSPAQSFPPMSKDPTLKPTKPAYGSGTPRPGSGSPEQGLSGHRYFPTINAGGRGRGFVSDPWENLTCSCC